jgi:hypothetical protein
MINEIVQYFNLENIPIRYKELMNEIKAKAESRGIKYTRISGRPNYLPEKMLSVYVDFNIVRLHELSERENILWLDSDCKIDDKLFEFNFEENEMYLFRGHCISSAIFNGKRTDLFKEIYSKYIPGKGCVCRQYLNANIKKFKFIPVGLIKHLKFRGRG